MTTKYSSFNDHYVPKEEVAQLHQLVLRAGFTVSTLAYGLRMSRTHTSCMLAGSKPMAMVHKLAIQMLLLKRKVGQGEAT